MPPAPDVPQTGSDRQFLQARLHALEALAERQTDALNQSRRLVQQLASDVTALRTSTSWKATRPLRLVSKCWSALRKGPAFWIHLYRVRDEALANWRRADSLPAMLPYDAPAATPSDDVPTTTGAADAPWSEISQVPVRARRALRRARGAVWRH